MNYNMFAIGVFTRALDENQLRYKQELLLFAVIFR